MASPLDSRRTLSVELVKQAVSIYLVASKVRCSSATCVVQRPFAEWQHLQPGKEAKKRGQASGLFLFGSDGDGQLFSMIAGGLSPACLTSAHQTVKLVEIDPSGSTLFSGESPLEFASIVSGANMTTNYCQRYRTAGLRRALICIPATQFPGVAAGYFHDE